ncbi:MAG: hypothetical protein HRT43_00895, partial [Campylobacteraceae bacterium]|nr:hypothetical protein [Campylobacteraceae bacterium]
SGFVHLENSSKEFVFTPNSFIAQIDLFYIWFDDNHMYEIEQHNENNKIYFNNSSSEKKIYEQYKLVLKPSSLSLKDEVLYYNGNILLEKIKSFKVTRLNKHLTINICQSSCQEWIFKL